MFVEIQIFEKQQQRIYLENNDYVRDVINKIIRENKLKENNSELGLFLNGNELQEHLKIFNLGTLNNKVLQLKHIKQPRQQGIKLVYNNEIQVVQVQNKDYISTLYNLAQQLFSFQNQEFQGKKFEDVFKLIYEDQILHQKKKIEQYSIGGNSIVEIKRLSQQDQTNLRIELRVVYEQKEKHVVINLQSQVIELEEIVMKLFNINEDICIFNNQMIMQSDEQLVNIAINKKKCLLVLLKNLYVNQLKFVNIILEYKGQQYPHQVSTDTIILEIITLYEQLWNVQNIGLKCNSKILPEYESISKLNIQENSILTVYDVNIQNNLLLVNLKIGSKIEQMEVNSNTLIGDLIQQIQASYQLQSIELVLQNGTVLNKEEQSLVISLEKSCHQNGQYISVNSLQYINNFIIIYIQVQEQNLQYDIPNNTLISQIEQQIKNQMKIQGQVQLIFQNRILNSQRMLSEEDIKNGSHLQCQILQSQNFKGQKIRILNQQGIQQDKKTFKINYLKKQEDVFIDESTPINDLIKLIKQRFQIAEQIQVYSSNGTILDSQKIVKDYNFQNNDILFVRKFLQIAIQYSGNQEYMEVRDDTLVEDLIMQIKIQFRINCEFDVLIGGKKLDPKLTLINQILENGQFLEVQKKQQKINKQVSNEKFQFEDKNDTDNQFKQNQQFFPDKSENIPQHNQTQFYPNQKEINWQINKQRQIINNFNFFQYL